MKSIIVIEEEEGGVQRGIDSLPTIHAEVRNRAIVARRPLVEAQIPESGSHHHPRFESLTAVGGQNPAIPVAMCLCLSPNT